MELLKRKRLMSMGIHLKGVNLTTLTIDTIIYKEKLIR